jgi:hypothetical protein
MTHTRTFSLSVFFFLVLANLTPFYALGSCPEAFKDHELLSDSCTPLHPSRSGLMECCHASFCPQEIRKAEIAACPAGPSSALARSVVSSLNGSSISTFLPKWSPARRSGLFFRQDFLVGILSGGPAPVNLPSDPLYILNLSLLI